ncbi:YcaO-like family protein [Georgenia faecalis]|uniref:YcaO-like family protein n=1 Tax=Georgenia faecalis TaxID=2483799 RepID=A0ABV9DDF4_9MICO|nr:YcaO-like family protein [Georgenia faecalis]
MSALTPAVVHELLRPEAGLARGFELVRHPDPPHLYLMVVDVGTRFASTTHPTVHDLAGAFDLQADGAVRRGLGEAVERCALAPRETGDPVRATLADLRAAGTAAADAEHWPGHWPVAEREDTTWYPAEELGSGCERLVPSAWVDCPVTGPLAARWEGTPSGAAAHTSLDAATAVALAEVLERDALMRTWFRPDRAAAVEVELAGDARLARLVSDQPQVTVRAACVPTALPDRHAYVAWVDDGVTIGTGAVAAAAEPEGVVKAVQEAWQIYLALRSRARTGGTAEDGARAFVAHGEARCDFWTDGRGREAMRAWAQGLGPARPMRTDTPGEPAPAAAGLAARGFPVLRVDLTHRLPAAVRDAGFVAVKVLVGGLQPLVLDEAADWPFVDTRLGRRRTVVFQPLI